MTRHQRAVNVVRWSPSGEFLASGDDESVIFIWKLKSENETVNIMESTNDQDKETWITYKILRGHMEDVYDLSWSPNSTQLISGSVDNTAILWDIHKGKSFHILNDHKGFVQGVAWDPQNQYLATLSTDRYFRVYDINTKKIISRCSKSPLPLPKDHKFHGKNISLYHDDTLQTFFRRLSFSPDGMLVITPAGVAEHDDASSKLIHTTYIYTRNSYKQPAIVLPSPDQFTVAVKFCPVLFQLRKTNPEKPPVIPLHYRMIFAVATKSSVYLYDTQQRTPFALISNIHYARLTDLTWSPDGKILIVSSTDGFCSIITFGDDELGSVYEKSEEEIENDKKILQQSQPIEKSKKKHRNSDAVKMSSVVVDKNTDDTLLKKTDLIDAQDRMTEASDTPEEEIMDISDTQDQTEIITDSQEKKKDIPNTQDTETDAPSINDQMQEVSDAKDAMLDACDKQEPASEASKTQKENIDGSDTSSNDKCIPEIIVPSDKIISSDDKFESPEKVNKPATPIPIRRHPRVVENVSSNSPNGSVPSPIAIKRRAIVTPASTGKTNIEDDVAMDCWPTDQARPISTATKKETASHLHSDVTEDFTLVIDDDEEEEVKKSGAEIVNLVKGVADKKQDVGEGVNKEFAQCSEENKTPGREEDKSVNKTPRRVAFRTISTPKSKKKLID